MRVVQALGNINLELKSGDRLGLIGHNGAGNWVLEYQPTERERNDPLMGWWGSSNTLGQVRLRFDTAEAAVAFAEQKGVAYDLEAPPASRPIKPTAYADNFRYGRAENWTH